MSANPPDHPFESDPSFDPETHFQRLLDVHLDALAAEFEKAGADVISIVVSVRAKGPLDSAGNDVANGFRAVVDDDDQIPEVITSHVTRLLRSVRRAFTPELR